MVNIAKKSEFDKDFDSYLDHRINKSGPSMFFKKVESLIPSVFDKKAKKSNVGVKVTHQTPKKPFLSRIFERFYSKKQEDFEDEDFENLPKSKKQEVVPLEKKIEEVDEEVEELEEEREGLLRNFFKKLFGMRNKQEEFDEDDIPSTKKTTDPATQLKDETRNVLKSLHKWLSKLPPEHIDAFRRSADFVKYKELLEKYDLIKKD